LVLTDQCLEKQLIEKSFELFLRKNKKDEEYNRLKRRNRNYFASWDKPITRKTFKKSIGNSTEKIPISR
jgi:hypothetical protein